MSRSITSFSDDGFKVMGAKGDDDAQADRH
jgi:hypothetical protein